MKAKLGGPYFLTSVNLGGLEDGGVKLSEAGQGTFHSMEVGDLKLW